MAYVPPPGSAPDRPAGRSTFAAKVLLVIGVLLLLPGACTLYFVGWMFLTGWNEMIRDIGRGDPILQMIMTLWATCLVVSLGGIFLIRWSRAPGRRGNP